MYLLSNKHQCYYIMTLIKLFLYPIHVGRQ